MGPGNTHRARSAQFCDACAHLARRSRAAPVTMGDVRPGDWTCPSCGANVFASKMNCYKCQAPKPGGGGY